MKWYAKLLKLRESLLIHDPVIFKWLVKDLMSKKHQATFRTLNNTENMQVFVSGPVSVWLNRYVFVKFKLPFSATAYGDSAMAYAVVGKHGNYRFVPCLFTDTNGRVQNLLFYRPSSLHDYMKDEENMKDIMKAFTTKGA